MRNSMDSGFNEIKDVKGRRSIRDGSEEVNLPNRLKLNNNEDRSNSEPPRSFGTYHPVAAARLKPIREKIGEDAHGSSDDDENSQLNESDFDLEIPDSASASVSQTPTPTPLASSNARRINSETNLNETKRRMSGFMGNRSKRFCASTSELSFSSHLDTRKSLFSPKNNALSRQSFNSSLYGSNMSLSSTNSRLFMVNSPFYNGKTMFGGASAYPKRDINQHKILRTPVQMRPSSSLSNCSNTSAKSDNIVPESNAAKRILEIMNQFTGPLKEARAMGNNINSIIKIPSLVQDKKRYGESELNLDRSIALSSPSMPYGRPITSSKNRPESPISSITKPLQIPTMSQLLQMKRLQNNTERVREIASRSDSFLNRNHEYKLPSTGDETQGKGNSTATPPASSLKMKSNITKNLLRNDKHAAADQLPALPVNLPNIQLPEMRGIPKFDIQLPVASSPSVVIAKSPKMSVVTTIPAVQFNFQQAKSVAIKETLKSDFVLSKPLPMDVEDAGSLSHVSEKFTFTKPAPINEGANGDEEVPNQILAKSSVKSSSFTDNLFKNLVAQQKSASWECDSCLTRNDSEKTKCLCCDTSKKDNGISSQSPLSAAPSITPASDDLFKSLAAKQKTTSWECDACMTKNDANKDKCACCETAKPGSKPAAAVTAPPTSFSFGMPKAAPAGDDLFKSLVAKQKTTSWECDACMTRNDVAKESCMACETPKPGCKPAPSTTSSFSFGMKSSTEPAPSFSFGMPATVAKPDESFKKIVEKQAASWECTACMTRNEAAKSKCVCCEQSKPGTNEAAPYFSFSSKLKSTASVALPAPSEVKFSFGMTAAAATVSEELKDEVDKPKPTFAFGATNNTAASTSSFSFKAPSPSTTTTTSFTLKAPQEEVKLTEKPAMFSFGATPLAAAGASQASPVKTVTFGNAVKAPEPIKTVTEPAKAEETKKPEFGGFKFSAEPTVTAVTPQVTAAPSATPSTIQQSSAPPSFGSSLNKNGGFSFSGSAFGAKPTEEPAKPAAGGFSFGASANNSMTFGQTKTVTAAPAVAPATNSFVFGASNAENEAPKTFGSFGMNASPVKVSFGSANVQSAPVFPQSTFSFTAKKEEAAPSQSSIFAFGAKPSAPANNTQMLFGNNQSNQPQVTPVFGASAVPTFGASSTNNNNNSEFGSKMPSFGNQSQKRAFEFSSAPADVSQNKKFDFGGHQQQQQQQVNSAPFQFNSVAENKPAFNFAASAAPSFNFSHPTANNPQDQQNLYQFGANNSHSTQGIFAFAPTSAPVMQFGAGASAPQIAIPGITSFSAQGTGSSAAAANQRKILRARRTTTRR